MPEQSRSLILELRHSSPLSDHLGVNGTLDHTSRLFFWPHSNSDIAQFCKSCKVCQITSGRRTFDKVPMIDIPVIKQPFERIAMDVIGPLEKPKAGHRFNLVIIDNSTCYHKAIPFRTVTARNIADELVKYVSRYGLPHKILTDQGRSSQIRTRILSARETRLCADRRELNSITKDEIYSMTREDELTQKVIGYHYITIFDCRCG